MNSIRHLAIGLALSLPLLACGGDKQPSQNQAGSHEPETMLGKAVKQATDEAREKLASENMDVSSGDDGLPKAEITPKGDLLIDGKTVAINAAQRALLLEYRKHISDIALAGIDVGLQGADLAGKAISEAIAGVFSGDPDRVEKKIEAEAEKIEASASKICGFLPGMFATQQKLAAALPEFQPYAKMTQQDVDECNSEVASGVHVNVDADGHHAVGPEVRDTVRKAVREGVRESVREARTDIREAVRDVNVDVDVDVDVDESMNAAEEAEAAGAEAAKK